MNYVDVFTSATNYFGEDIFYDYGFTNSQLNGAIAGVKWKAGGDTIARAYGFTYDNANRITKADFSQNIRGTNTWTNATVDYTVSNLSYDASSNILSMKQRGLQIGSSATIDSLTYQYFTNSNQLQKISDGISDISPMGDFKDTTLAGDDYTYDVNGNINKDYNRHMHTSTNGPGVDYNLLDKPDSLCIKGKATLYYYYDAAGSTLRKQINDYTSGTTIVKNYLYLNGFVYLNDTLQYVAQEEGRIRWAKKRNNQNGSTYYAFEYDYFLRDHLNNVRTVITEGKDTASYIATMESADSATVQKLFSNVYDPVRTVSSKPAAFDGNGSNVYVSKLTGNAPAGGQGGRVGPSLVLKVMAGDKVQINTYAYYNGTTQTPGSDNTLLTDLLSTLVGGITSQSNGKIGSNNSTAVTNAVSADVLSMLNNRGYNNSVPKVYLNWVLLDNQFNYVASNAGAVQVIAGSSKQALVAPLQTIAKNGYLYVFLSNQSPQDVFFDDLTVTHTTGPLLQEQSYYPFGLQMSAIGDKAMNKLNSQNKFNGGVELEEDYGVNLYSTFYRQYDPQIGRFTGVDILGEETNSLSPYHFAANNPITFSDPSGAKFYKQEQVHSNVIGGGGGSGSIVDAMFAATDAFMYEQEEQKQTAAFWNNLFSTFENGVDEAMTNGIIITDDGTVIQNNGGRGIFVYDYDDVNNPQTYIGSLGRQVNANEIFKNLLDEHIKQADKWVMAPWTFYNLVKDHGDWDLKNSKSTIYGLAYQYDEANRATGAHTWFSFDGSYMRAEDLGNYHYGVVGRVNGWGEYLLLEEAGRAQPYNPKWQTPEMLKRYYGDDPWDQFMIRNGFQYYNRNYQ